MGVGQNVCLDNILDKIEMGPHQVIKESHVDISLKNPLWSIEATIFSLTVMKIDQTVSLS